MWDCLAWELFDIHSSMIHFLCIYISNMPVSLVVSFIFNSFHHCDSGNPSLKAFV